MTTSASLFPVNEIELVYRKKYDTPLVQVCDAHDAFEVLRNVWNINRIELLEEFKILLLDNSSTCLGVVDIASGGLDACAVDSRLIFAAALTAKATRIILAHNHPSGRLEPSKADIKTTNQLCKAAAILNIPILDHLIVTTNNYTSFACRKLLPEPD